MRFASSARRLVCAAAVGLVGSACTLTADLDRFKADGVPQDAATEEPPKCEKGVDCSGCAACESWCLCSALPAAYEGCVETCLDAGAF